MKPFEDWMAELGFTLAKDNDTWMRTDNPVETIMDDTARLLFAAACQAYEAGKQEHPSTMRGWRTGHAAGKRDGVTALLQAVEWPEAPTDEKLSAYNDGLTDMLAYCKAALTAATKTLLEGDEA